MVFSRQCRYRVEHPLPDLIFVVMGHVCLRVCLVTVAAVGMNLFGSVKYGQFLSRDANFSTFYLSMLTLFRYHLLVTGWPLWVMPFPTAGQLPALLPVDPRAAIPTAPQLRAAGALYVSGTFVVDSCAAVGLTCFGPFGLITLLTGRCSTGENFNGIMNDLSVQEPFCDPVYEGNCGYAQGCCRDPYCRLCTTHPRMCGYARWGPSARKEGGGV